MESERVTVTQYYNVQRGWIVTTDYSRYDGHTPAEGWHLKRLIDDKGKGYTTSYHVHVDLGPCMIWCPEGHKEQEANANLIADAPKLLAEVKRLQKQNAVMHELLNDISGDSAFSGFGDTTKSRIYEIIESDSVENV